MHGGRDRGHGRPSLCREVHRTGHFYDISQYRCMHSNRLFTLFTTEVPYQGQQRAPDEHTFRMTRKNHIRTTGIHMNAGVINICASSHCDLPGRNKRIAAATICACLTRREGGAVNRECGIITDRKLSGNVSHFWRSCGVSMPTECFGRRFLVQYQRCTERPIVATPGGRGVCAYRRSRASVVPWPCEQSSVDSANIPIQRKLCCPNLDAVENAPDRPLEGSVFSKVYSRL